MPTEYIALVMDRLDGTTVKELHEIREQTEEGKPREHVLAAIGRKQGDHLDTLAERRSVVEKIPWALSS